MIGRKRGTGTPVRTGRGTGRWLALGALAALALAASGPAAAQAQSAATEEVRLLREASRAEGAGDFVTAETSLRRVLEGRPGSVPALLSLDRILRTQGRLSELVAPVRRALEEDPRSALVNQLLVRTYSQLDRVDEMAAAADAWVAATPDIEIPYREVARLWQDRGEYARALAVLEEGRDRIDRADALALELGDLHMLRDAPDAAVEAWDRAIGSDGHGLTQVRRRIRALPDGGSALLAPLVERLTAPGSEPGRTEAALELAVDAGLQDRARSMAETLLPGRDLEGRRSLLVEVARRAESGRLQRLAYWAYSQLLEVEEELAWVRERTSDPRAAATAPDRQALEGRSLAIRARAAELALELGDTVGAAADYRALESGYDADAPERRHAAALRVELLATQSPDSARAALEAFRQAYPAAEEDGRLTAAVATGLVEADRVADAERLLVGVRGSHSALLRGRLALRRGEIDRARLEYMSAAPGLKGSEATRALSLVRILSRVPPEAGAVLGEAATLQAAGEPGAAVDRVVTGSAGMPTTARPVLLEFAATLAMAEGLTDDARRIRRRIVEEHPRSTEAPDALLALARDLAATGDGRGEAVELLERLIVEYPRSALVPQARRELGRLNGPGGGPP